MPHPSASATTAPGSAFKKRSRRPPIAPVARRGELLGGVLEAEREQEEHHADLGCQPDEVFREVGADDAAFAEHEACDEVGGDGADADPVGDPGEDRQAEDDRPELDEGDRDVVGRRRGHASASREARGQRFEAFGRADGDGRCARDEHVFGAGRRGHVVAVEQCDDGHAGL